MRKILIVACILCTLVTTAQINTYGSRPLSRHDLDQIHHQLSQATSDTLRLRLLLTLAQGSYHLGNADSLRFFSEQAIQLAKQTKQLRAEINATSWLVRYYWERGIIAKALDLSLKNIQTGELTKDTVILLGTINSAARTYAEAKEYRKVLELTDRARRIVHSGFFKGERAIKAQSVVNYITLRGEAFEALKQLDSAFFYKTLNFQTASFLQNHQMLALSTVNLGQYYERLNKGDSAIRYYLLCIPYAHKSGFRFDLAANAELGLGRIYSRRGLVDSALKYGQNAYYTFHRMKHHRDEAAAAELIQKLFARRNRIDSAYHYLNAAVFLRDSLFNEGQLQQIEAVKFNERLRVQQLEQEKKDAIAAEKLNQQRLLALHQQQQLQIAADRLQLLNQQKEISQLAFLRTEAELRAAQSQRKEKEKQLAIAQQEKELQNANLKIKTSELDLKNQELASKQLERNVLIGGALTFMLIGIVLWRNNRNKQKAYNLLDRQKKETEEQKERLEVALTDLRVTQAQLVQREKMASLGELTAGIAHEIQNPLNFVNNFAEVNIELLHELKTELNAGNADEVVAIANDISDNEQKISFHGKRADNIVKGMLQHSRATTGNKQPTDINALADEYLRLSYHGFRAKDKSFNCNIISHFDKAVNLVDIVSHDIGRVLLNLLNNAFYSVNEKNKQLNGTFEPTVEVSTERVDKKVEICVKDNGVGIPQKVLDKIYQPFFTTKPTGQGTGLGLSLSYDIITKGHGGEMKVETKEGEGAEFIIQLPLQ